MFMWYRGAGVGHTITRAWDKRLLADGISEVSRKRGIDGTEDDDELDEKENESQDKWSPNEQQDELEYGSEEDWESEDKDILEQPFEGDEELINEMDEDERLTSEAGFGSL